MHPACGTLCCGLGFGDESGGLVSAAATKMGLAPLSGSGGDDGELVGAAQLEPLLLSYEALAAKRTGIGGPLGATATQKMDLGRSLSFDPDDPPANGPPPARKGTSYDAEGNRLPVSWHASVVDNAKAKSPVRRGSTRLAPEDDGVEFDVLA